MLLMIPSKSLSYEIINNNDKQHIHIVFSTSNESFKTQSFLEGFLKNLSKDKYFITTSYIKDTNMYYYEQEAEKFREAELKIKKLDPDIIILDGYHNQRFLLDKFPNKRKISINGFIPTEDGITINVDYSDIDKIIENIIIDDEYILIDSQTGKELLINLVSNREANIVKLLTLNDLREIVIDLNDPNKTFLIFNLVNTLVNSNSFATDKEINDVIKKNNLKNFYVTHNPSHFCGEDKYAIIYFYINAEIIGKYTAQIVEYPQGMTISTQAKVHQMKLINYGYQDVIHHLEHRLIYDGF